MPILLSILPHVAFDGWSHKAIKLGKKDLGNEVILGIDHKLYNHMTKISEHTRKALIKDFA